MTSPAPTVSVLSRVVLGIMAISILGTFGVLMASSGSGGGGAMIVIVILMALWAVSPYAGLAFIAHYVRRSAAACAVLLAGALPIGGFGIYAIIDAMFIHLDAQGGLIFLFLPLVQWVGVFLFSVVALAIKIKADGSS